MSEKHFLVVGAGFSGAVIARELAIHTRCKVTVIDEREHIAGNCYTSRDLQTGIMVHKYGPHIFNTNREDVWRYVNEFGSFESFTNRVKACIKKGVFSLPINLHTINQFYGTRFSPEEGAKFIALVGDKSITAPKNFEEQALKMLGRDLYYSFFYGYTKKQWGCEPVELPSSVLKRLPIRFNYNDNYYATRFQGMPVAGYTAIVSNILDHPQIIIQCGLKFQREMIKDFSHVFYSGTLDRFFGYIEGRLGYRTVTFKRGYSRGDYQGNAVINYPDFEVPYTRIHEHKHFAPWESNDATVFFEEFSKETTDDDCPYYPKRLVCDMKAYSVYRNLAIHEQNVSFIGRLGTYRYLNMDQAIGEALDFSREAIKSISLDKSITTFSGDDL